MNIITITEVSKLTRLDTRTLQKQAQSGYFPNNVCGRLGRKYLFNEEALLEFIFTKRATA